MKIAIDSNAAEFLLKHYGAEVYEGAQRGRWEVFLPIIVYAEQSVWKGHLASAIIDGLSAQVVPLDQNHADALGGMWDNLRGRPRPGESPEQLWRRHKCDWLIAAMCVRESWLLVSDDGDFQRIKDTVGLNVIKVDDFVQNHLTAP